jgi:hypothetical protein
LLLIAGFIGWRIKGAVDGGEIRGARAGADAADQRVRLAHDQYEGVIAQIGALNAKVEQQDKIISELKNMPAPAARVQELAAGNNEIKSALTTLASSTTELGTTLTIVGGKYRLMLEPMLELTKRSTR